jgi:hypothetical protein
MFLGLIVPPHRAMHVSNASRDEVPVAVPARGAGGAHRRLAGMLAGRLGQMPRLLCGDGGKTTAENSTVIAGLVGSVAAVGSGAEGLTHTAPRLPHVGSCGRPVGSWRQAAVTGAGRAGIDPKSRKPAAAGAGRASEGTVDAIGGSGRCARRCQIGRTPPRIRPFSWHRP